MIWRQQQQGGEMLKKIQHKELRIKNFSLASRFLAFSSLSSCIAGKRDNLPLSLDALKSKAGVSLKKKKKIQFQAQSLQAAPKFNQSG